MGSAFSRFVESYAKIVARPRPSHTFLGRPAREWISGVDFQPNSCSSGCDFGENVHSSDLGGDPEVRSGLFDADNGGLAAGPALLAQCECGREDQDQLDVGSLLHLGVAVEEDAVGAYVPGFGAKVGPVRGCAHGWKRAWRLVFRNDARCRRSWPASQQQESDADNGSTKSTREDLIDLSL